MSGIEEWNAWRVRREERLRQPHGTLALVGTHWLEAEPAPIVPGEPVLWSGDAKTVTVTAKAEHGLLLDGAPIDGTVTLYPDTAEHPSTVTVPDGDLLLVPIERDGVPALRVYDPNAETRRSFDGIDAFDYAPSAVVEAVFTPYPAERTEQGSAERSDRNEVRLCSAVPCLPRAKATTTRQLPLSLIGSDREVVQVHTELSGRKHAGGTLAVANRIQLIDQPRLRFRLSRRPGLAAHPDLAVCIFDAEFQVVPRIGLPGEGHCDRPVDLRLPWLQPELLVIPVQ